MRRPSGSPESLEQATDVVLTHEDPSDFVQLFASIKRERGLLGGVLDRVGHRIGAGAMTPQVERLLYYLFIDQEPFEIERILEHVRVWPDGPARQEALRSCMTDVQREMLAPTTASAKDIADDLASPDSSSAARVLRIVAGLPSTTEPGLVPRFGIEVLERAGSVITAGSSQPDGADENGLAFLRIVTQFRGFTPPLRHAARIRLAVDAVVRTTDPTLGWYFATWLLEQGHAEVAIDETLGLMVTLAPTTEAWSAVGDAFLRRIWLTIGRDDEGSRRSLRVQEQHERIRATLHRHLGRRADRNGPGSIASDSSSASGSPGAPDSSGAPGATIPRWPSERLLRARRRA